MTDLGSDRLIKLLAEAKLLAKEYYQLTGKPLGVTGEVAEFEVNRILGFQLCKVRQQGYDAWRDRDCRIKLQVKGRAFLRGKEAGQRIGKIDLTKEWDAVVLVLLDLDYEAREIWEADRNPIKEALLKPGSISRNARGALPVTKFKQIGTLLWSRPDPPAALEQDLTTGR